MESLNSEDDEDWLKITTPSSLKEAPADEPVKKRQKKVITLDDILIADHKETVRKLKPRKNNKLLQKLKAKSHLYSSSSSSDDGEDRPNPAELLDDLEKQVTSVAEEVEPEWGLPVLGFAPSEPPSLTRGGAPSLLRALQASKEGGRETTLEELATSGFLRAWAVCANRCDESTLRWAYHQMAHSSDECLERATCKFLCDLVSQSSSDSETPFKMDWLPTLEDFRQTLVVYGYREHTLDAEDTESPSESTERRPAKNLRSVLEFIATCFVRRNIMQPFYSAVDISSLLCIMVHLTLERGLLEMLDKIQDCIVVLLRYFTPEEWEMHCTSHASTISMFTAKPHNGVFILGVLSGLGNRSVDLQRHLALHELTTLARRRTLLANPRDVTALFENVNLKAKFVDFKKLYYQVVIADTFLWCNEGLSDELAKWTWLKFLGLCSRVIYIGDERPFATKLRNTASLLVVKYEHEGFDRDEASPLEGASSED